MNGIESLLIDIFRNIDMSDIEIDLIMALDAQEIPVHEPEAQALGIHTIHICDMNGLYKKYQYLSTLFRLLRSGKYDVVHANMDMLNGVCLLLARLAGIPKRICHAHNTSNVAVSSFSVKGFYYRLMHYLIRRNTTCAVGCSEAANRNFFGKENRAAVLPNAIDLQRFREPGHLIDPRTIGMEEDTQYIVTVGRISEPKNPLFILDILHRLCGRRDHVKLVWIGSGAMESTVHTYAEKLHISDRILFLGARTDVNHILPLCDVFLFPSLYEGFGIVLLEAQAAGLPCVVSAQIPHDADVGGCVFLSLQQDASVWADKICAILDGKSCPVIDPERLNTFDIQEIAKKMHEIYIAP